MKQSYPDLRGKVVIVTGGSRGIGAATSREFAAQGSKVGVIGRDEGAINSVVELIRREGGQALGVVTDCTDFDAIERMRAKVEDEFGPTDVVAAFAGGSTVRPGPFGEIGLDQWRSVLDTNLTTAFLTAKCFLPGMADRGRGSLITMASTAGRMSSPAPAAYAAAKAGVLMLSRNLASEFGNRGIRVNCIAPSTIATERLQLHLSEETRREIAASVPLGRLGSPEDVAHAALFLASESASWVTGITLDVSGGKVML
jgi:3-oxoacyl-[acyl-carrier protein] reductase